MIMLIIERLRFFFFGAGAGTKLRPRGEYRVERARRHSAHLLAELRVCSPEECGAFVIPAEGASDVVRVLARSPGAQDLDRLLGEGWRSEALPLDSPGDEWQMCFGSTEKSPLQKPLNLLATVLLGEHRHVRGPAVLRRTVSLG